MLCELLWFGYMFPTESIIIVNSLQRNMPQNYVSVIPSTTFSYFQKYVTGGCNSIACFKHDNDVKSRIKA